MKATVLIFVWLLLSGSHGLAVYSTQAGCEAAATNMKAQFPNAQWTCQQEPLRP
jgi:hypothetical protein